MSQRPGGLAHTTHGEPLNRRFNVEAGSNQGGTMSAAAGDGDGSVHYHTGDISFDQFVTLLNAGATRGMRWMVVRVTASGGPLSLVVESESFGTLSILNAGDWMEAVFDGTEWILSAHGSGV